MIFPEACPEPVLISIPHCKDAAHAALSDVTLSSLGRILQLDLTIKSVCPGKRVAVSVIVSETGPQGEELPRGVKHILVPAQTGESCQDIVLKCIQFSLPEALDPSGSPSSICSTRNMQVKAIANYVDTDFSCCENQNVTL